MGGWEFFAKIRLIVLQAKKDAKENKMFNVKYSCLKNLGLICAEREDNRKAIEYLLDVCVESYMILK